MHATGWAIFSASVSHRDDYPPTSHTMTSETFVRSADTPWQSTNDAGLRRQILGHGPDLMMVRVEFEPGAVGALHHHPHRQVAYVVSGRFEVTVGEGTMHHRCGRELADTLDRGPGFPPRRIRWRTRNPLP